MTTRIYRSYGNLTGYIDSENVQQAQEYLREFDMTQYLEGSLAEAVTRIEWTLLANGYSYYVEAITSRKLRKTELKELADWVSGQNSDGLGENFEQQAFAWDEDAESDDGYEEGNMISFDWKTNKSEFSLV